MARNPNAKMYPGPYPLGPMGTAVWASAIWGSGQDQAVIFDGVNTFPFATLLGGVYTLTRDIFIGGSRPEAGKILRSFVNSGITLFSAGYKIFCNGELINRGIIHNDGKNAALSVAGGSSTLGSLGIGTAGGNGRSNNTGLAGVNQANMLQDALAAGGAGGAGGANAGGAGGTYGGGTSGNGGANYLTSVLMGYIPGQTSGGNQAQLLIIGGGAGGGGGGSDNAGVAGGGGGGGGGVLALHAFRLINEGIIRVRGGSGAPASGAGGNGGGGGGGGGGILLSMCHQITGSGTIDLSGGAGGAPIGTGIAGAAGRIGHKNIFPTP